MTQQSGGGGVQVTQTVAGVLSGNLLAPAFSTNGTTPLFGVVEAYLTADVPISNTTSYFDGVSLTLSAGTWLVWCTTGVTNGVSSSSFSGRLWDGGTTVLQESPASLAAGFYGHIHAEGQIVVASSVSVRMSVKSNVSTATIKATETIGGTTNKETHIMALRIA